MTDSLHVIGGAGGTDVQYDELAATARLLAGAAVDVTETAVSAQRVLADIGLLASAALDPAGFAAVEAAVLAAVAGPHGVLAAAAALEQKSLQLEAAVIRYATADHLDSGWREVRQWAEGTAAAASLPAIALLAPSFALSAAEWTHDVGGGEFLAEHPGVAEDAAGAAPSFLDTLLLAGLNPLSVAERVVGTWSGHPQGLGSMEGAAGFVAALYPDGRPLVGGRGVDRSAPAAPRGVADLLAALTHRDELAQGTAQGEIDVRRLTRFDAAGRQVTSWIVDVPGTKDWQADPRRRDHLNDLATNLTAMAGTHTARVDGLTQAMRQAGVQPGEPVMLVGHSQGGLVALRAAEQYTRDGSFAVTHVVTAGSPTARMAVPASVSVLALENRYDVVPQLDGRPSPPDVNRVTVVFDAQSHDVGLNHALASTYLPAAALLDADNDPSLVAWREGASAFLAAPGEPVEVQTSVWDISNAP